MAPVDLRPRPTRRRQSPLWHLNAALARPIAALFGLLGVAPGQLSLQSVTLTGVGLLRAASGDWIHLVEGALILYGALLLDRADDLLAERSAALSAWSRFLGVMADRIVEVALVIALGWLPTRSAGGWQLLGPSNAWLLVAALVATMLLARLATAYGDFLILRIHLATARRLPGPSAYPAGRQVQPWLSRLVDRDVFVAVAVLGIGLKQFQLAALLLLAGQAVVLVEQFVLFRSRQNDPEPHAASALLRGP